MIKQYFEHQTSADHPINIIITQQNSSKFIVLIFINISVLSLLLFDRQAGSSRTLTLNRTSHQKI